MNKKEMNNLIFDLLDNKVNQLINKDGCNVKEAERKILLDHDLEITIDHESHNLYGDIKLIKTPQQNGIESAGEVEIDLEGEV